SIRPAGGNGLGQRPRPPLYAGRRLMVGSAVLTSRGILTLLLVGAAIWSLTAVPWGTDLVHPGGGRAIGEFFGAIFHLDLSPAFLALAVRSAWQTLAYGLTAMTVAVAIGVVLGIAGSGTVAGRRLTRLVAPAAVRGGLGLLRSIHELVWAWLLVAALGLSPLAGVLAVGIPYGGILGRIYADTLIDAPQAPLRALETAGASRWQVLIYGRLPQALPDLVSYTLYRTECALRSAAVLSFVGLGGLGQQIQLSLDELLYGQVWTLLLVLVALVALTDLWSSEIRRRLTG
ncbi:MAG TPA: ABC transporter permease subunit, partial [Dehalococcoidia bacterium]|nr:ABC transporter permease subunit [Dehalococcoidia bacterium]